MALSAEQQAQVDIQVAVQTAAENIRHTNQMILQARQTKLEAVRLAKDTLIENSRSKPADSREITAANIITFADALVASIDA
jgi:hypothetical protein